MTVRLIVAYSLMGLMTLTIAAAVWWKMYHSAQRVHARRTARLAQARPRRMQTDEAEELAAGERH